VAIVGAGPAGLAAAIELRRAGHRVVIFDAWPAPGGVLRYGIPSFKLPKDLIEGVWSRLAAADGELVANTRIESESDLARLRSDGFDAILLAFGASAPNRLGIPGEDLPGIWTATNFLVRANLPSSELPPDPGEALAVGDRVVVIGGGDTAMDCCRTAVRLGAADVLCVYRRTETEMLGRREERAYARDEGVRFEFLSAPIRLLEQDGHLAGVECVRTELGEPDASGRRHVTPVPDSAFVVPATSVVVAVGYHVADGMVNVSHRSNGTLSVDPATRATSLTGVFAAGDAVNGPDLVVTAVAAGRQAAAAITEYLSQ
jgi:glutamate synthase (NADPH/NADH) small chain